MTQLWTLSIVLKCKISPSLLMFEFFVFFLNQSHWNIPILDIPLDQSPSGAGQIGWVWLGQQIQVLWSTPSTPRWGVSRLKRDTGLQGGGRWRLHSEASPRFPRPGVLGALHLPGAWPALSSRAMAALPAQLQGRGVTGTTTQHTKEGWVKREAPPSQEGRLL